MSYVRIRIDLAFRQPLPPAVNDKLDELKALIVQGKAYAEKINAGSPNEENTVRASYHICRHDTGDSCDPEIII